MNILRFNTLYVVGSKTVSYYKTFWKSVSIHYMLLVQPLAFFISVSTYWFQYIICCWFKCFRHFFSFSFFCFNTLYVVGSTTSSAVSWGDLVFQYIICCWFKSGTPAIVFNQLRFNTLYVVGSIY